MERLVEHGVGEQQMAVCVEQRDAFAQVLQKLPLQAFTSLELSLSLNAVRGFARQRRVELAQTALVVGDDASSHTDPLRN